MNPTRAEILAAVARHAAGITTEALALEMNTTRYNICGALSKLAAYGKIDRDKHPHVANANIWKPKQEKPHDRDTD